MRKLIMFFSMLVLLLPIIFAQTKIFSGNIITDTDKVVNGDTFKFTYDERSNKAFVQTPTTGLIVENGACKSNNIFRVCINKANFSYKNITTYVYYYQLDVTIYKLTGSLSTSSKSTSSTLFLQESAELTITITNPTDFDITNIIYIEDLAPFSIKEVKGCTKDGNQLRWQGSLKSKYDKVCTATIIAEKEGTYNLAGNLSYFNSLETENKTTDTVAITVLPSQLNFNQKADSNIEIKKPFYINASVSNINKNEKIELSITLELPDNIKLLKDVEGFVKTGNTLRHNILLYPGSSLDYSLYLEASKEANNAIKHIFDYTIKNIRVTMQNYTSINATEPKPIINFVAEYPEVKSGQKFIVFVKLTNPSRVYELKDIKARLNVPYNHEVSQRTDKLKPNESFAIISSTFVVPENIDIQANSTIRLNLEVDYTFESIAKSLNKSLELKIKLPSINITNVSITNITSAKTDIQAPQEPEINETASNQSLPQSYAEAEYVTAIDSTKKWYKVDFSDKRIWFLLIFIFIIIFIIPIIIYNIKKKKMGTQYPQIDAKKEPRK